MDTKQLIKLINKELKDITKELGGKRALERTFETDIDEMSSNECFHYGMYRAYEMLLSELTNN